MSAITLAVVLIATLTPASDTTQTSEFWCIACGEFGGLDVLNNIVMFVPLGFAFALASNRRWASVAVCVGITLFVESMQVRIVTGRDASLSDLVANSVGGLIGVELAIRRSMLFQPHRRIAGRLTIAGAALFALITSLTSAGLRPATIPRSLWVQWTPDRPPFVPFTGELISFRLDSINLPRQFYPPRSLGVDRVLSQPWWHATATVRTENLAARNSVIARIAEEWTVLLSVEQHGWDLQCLEKTRSSDFRFRSPKVMLRDALRPSSDSPAAPVSLTCSREGPALTAASRERQGELRLSPSLGWLLLCPFNIAIDDRFVWIGAIWLMALAFPAGYWLRFVAERRAALAADSTSERSTVASIAVALLLGLVITPVLTGTAMAAIPEWIGSVAGIALGAATASVVLRWSAPAAATLASAAAPIADTP